MSQQATLPFSPATSSPSALGRAVAMAYGMTCYGVGVAGLVALILVTLGVLPLTGGPITIEGEAARIAFNLSLIAAFGLQHAVMARDAFKRRWTQIIPASVERSTFTALSGLIAGAIVWLWQPQPSVIWQVEGTFASYGLRGLCGLGWAYLLAATFAIDHFELFGVKQVWRNLRGTETPPANFKERFMYRFDRHPIMTGVLVGLWSTPVMTLDHLVLALGFTGYIVIGVTIEERDLRRKHGTRYAEYARRVRTIVPRLARD